MRHLKRIANVLAIALVASCGGGGDEDAPTDDTAQRLAALQDLRNKWEASASPNYQYTFSRFCFCADFGPYEVTVQSGAVTRAVYQGEAGATVSALYAPTETLGRLFDIAAQAIASHAVTVSYTVDPQHGYITQLYIDHFKEMADDEINYSASGYMAN
jgi:hypothetical protein